MRSDEQTPSSVLLVEDETRLRDLLADAFRREGFQVHCAPDGVIALEILARENIEIMVLDWMLPRLDGPGVLARVRAESALPILMLTARDDEMDRVAGLEWGADDYLVKPFSTRELIARVRALLRRAKGFSRDLAKAQPQDETLTLNGLSMNIPAHEARLHQKPMRLTRLEFALLHLLATNPRRVFSRDYLLERLWDGVSAGYDRSVDNAVLRLRKKLREWDGAIESVYGVGYRLKPPETQQAAPSEATF